jgi:hypothetical protein
VHNHDLNNTIRFRFELSIAVKFGETSVPEKFEENDTIFDEILENFPADQKRIKKFYHEQFENNQLPWMEFRIRQESTSLPPYLKYISIGIGKRSFFSIETKQNLDSKGKPEGLHSTLTCKDVKHPLLRKEHEEVITELLVEDGPKHAGDTSDEIKLSWPLNRLPEVSFECGYEMRWCDGEFIEKPVPERYIAFNEILNTIWDLHVSSVQEDLENFCYIGPLRQIPDTTEFTPFAWEDLGLWADGKAAWMYLTHEATHNEIKEVNNWLSSEDKFNTGYKILKKERRHLDVNASLYEKIITTTDIDALQSLQEEIKNLPLHTSLFFQPLHNDILLKPKDIGVGISQLLPIIPLVLQESYWGKTGLVAIEQPELHIHPAMQTVLGDLLIESLGLDYDLMGEKRFLIETHSEHLLLRLLRRLRDHGDLGNFIEPDELGIYFMEPSKDGAKVTRIRVNKEGEFKNPWPRGFFNERAEELF